MIEPNMFPSLLDSLQSNWGEHPSRSVNNECMFRGTYDEVANHRVSQEHRTGWCRLHPEEQEYVEMCFAGKTLQQALERFTFSFCVDGCTRAETHQIVRTRVGAGFMQHGGRDNDWRHRGWTMPETIVRACEADMALRDAARMCGFAEAEAGSYPAAVNDRAVCVTNWDPIEQLVGAPEDRNTLRQTIKDYLAQGKRLYAALVDAGIPWQDARRVLWMGTQTYIHCDYNYVALKGVLANRLEHIMDWEVNCVAQLMQREVNMKCPSLFGKYLGSRSDAAKRAMFAGLESWPPDGKWPTTPEQDALPRQHTAAQMPFWVLSPAAMAGGPIEWIWTNGVYPYDRIGDAR
jgi:thymidylate synthase ThyX